MERRVRYVHLRSNSTAQAWNARVGSMTRLPGQPGRGAQRFTAQATAPLRS